MEVSPLVLALEFVGVIAFAISGAMLAEHKHMDIVGVVVFSTIVAIAGGTIRDILLGQVPVFWVTDPLFILTGTITAVVTIPLAMIGTIDLLRRFRIISLADAAGLAVFSVVGTSMALNAGASSLAAISVGVISGLGGGIVRDVLASRVPEALSGGRMYTTAALIGSLLFVALHSLEVPNGLAVWLPILAIFGIRLLSVAFGMRVPVVPIPEDKRSPTSS